MVWHERLSVRLMIPIVAVLAISIGGSLGWLAGKQEDRVLERGRQQAALVNDVVKAALRNQMLGRTESATQDTIGRIRRSGDLREITLLDKSGVVRFSSDATRVGERVDRSDDACATCHASGSHPERSARLVERADGHRVFRSMSLLANEPECHACHGDADRYLGILALDQDVEPSLAAVAEDRRTLTGVGGVALALVAGLVAWIVLTLVQKPVNALVRGTRRVRGRDLDTRIEVGVRGELGELADSFNAMVADTKAYVEDIQGKKAEIATLYSFVERVSRSLDLATLRRIVVDLLVESFPGTTLGAIVLRRPDGTAIEATVRRSDVEGVDVVTVDPGEARRLGGVVDPAVLSRWLAGATSEPATFDGGAGRAIPARTGDTDGALLVVRRSAGASFSKAEAHLLGSLAARVAVAVDNARLYEVAVTDESTGLYSPRFFHQRLAREVDGYRRCGRGVSLLMLEVDDIRRANDACGHPVADRCLREVAAAVRRIVRDVGVACRYGGEEFAVILPDTEGRSAVGVAERIRAEVEASSVATDHGLLAVTVSVGVAACPADAATAGELLEAADGALYAAKQAGRNRVACAEPPSAVPGKTTACRTGRCPQSVPDPPRSRTVTPLEARPCVRPPRPPRSPGPRNRRPTGSRRRDRSSSTARSSPN